MNVADHKCFQNTGSFLLNIIVSLCKCINSAWSSFVTSILYYSVFLTVLPQYLVLVLLLLPHKKWRWKKPAGSGSYKKRPYGYQYCRILWKFKSLSVWDNDISDISPLSSLENLRVLYLGENNVTNLNPLKSCTNLQQLYLYQGEKPDLSPLDSLPDLEVIYKKRWTKVEDIFWFCSAKGRL